MKSLIDYLEHWAAVDPDKCLSCFLDADGSEKARYTYSAFSNHTRDLAAYLSREVGLKHGDRVLLAYPPGLEIIAAFFACVRVGIIPVPVAPLTSANAEASMAKLAFIGRDCQARALLTTRESRRSHSSLRSMREGSAFSKSGAPVPDLESITTDDLDLRAPNGFRDDPNEILFLQYTSGSTSEPKGVVVAHANVIHNASSTVDHVPIGVSWLPQYHDMGLIGYYLFPVIMGATTYGFSPIDFLKRPLLWLRTISRVRATYSSSPNFGFEYCLREDKVPSEQLGDVDLSSLRVLMNAAEPVRADTYLRFFERFAPHGLRREAHVVAYGLAENTLAATHYGRRIVTVNKRQLQRGTLQVEDGEPMNGNALRLASCGAPLDGVKLQIVESQSRTAVDDGKVGEIWLGGKSTCQGYWERVELSQAVFHNALSNASGDDTAYVRTGDIGFVQDGELFVCGRVKDLIIVRGVNYYPHDIERIVESTSEQIRTGCVAAFNGEDERETLIVLVEIRLPGDLPDPAEIARAIRTQYNVAPHSIAFVPPRTIVKTTSGKIARQLTRRRWLNGELPVIAIHVCVNDRDELSGEPGGLRQRFRYITDLHNRMDCEESTFDQIGIDSLALVRFLLDIQLLLEEHGASDLAEEVDLELLQQLTVKDFVSLLDQFESNPVSATASWRLVVHRAKHEYNNRVRERMRSDARFAHPHILRLMPDDVVTDVLFTGATGFFGPFLLNSLLRQTACNYYVLTRAADPGQAMDRIRESLRRSRIWTMSLDDELERRVHVVCGDLARPNLGLTAEEWTALTTRIHAVCHNAALVNYVLNYEALRPHNVVGTRELLRFSFAGRAKEFHYISTTFIFGWTAKTTLLESDNNDDMMNLDFGYAQTKWAAEQLVTDAERQGLKVRVYRPSLISASTGGVWDPKDIAIRLLAFMIKHGIAVDARNQISFLPADIVADNIACIFGQRQVDRRTLHVTADDYYSMVDITRLMTVEYGYRFVYYDIPAFIAEMNRRCTRDEPLYPLLDFFNRSYQKIAAMQFKRYNSDAYRGARAQSPNGRPDPSLKETVSYIMAYLRHEGLIPDPAKTSAL